MGDLNFRVDLPDGEVRKLVENKDWAGMLIRDQVCFFQPPSPPSPPPPVYAYLDVVSFADKRSFDGKIPFGNEIAEE